MTETDSSLSSSQPVKSKPRHRHLEIDGFVDHFLSTMCDHSRRRIMELLALPHGEDEVCSLWVETMTEMSQWQSYKRSLLRKIKYGGEVLLFLGTCSWHLTDLFRLYYILRTRKGVIGNIRR
jgi:hypothetical protein